jgi:hypothetical protein
MLEYWNDGTMGSGKMGQWFIVKIPFVMDKTSSDKPRPILS